MNKAPKGRKMIAQGKASLRATPWVTSQINIPPFPAQPGERSEYLGEISQDFYTAKPFRFWWNHL
jgi:hypothetical protein